MTNYDNSHKDITDHILYIANEARPWIKFLGVMSVISGVLLCVSCYGIIIGWLPIWLGVVLLQAGNSINNANHDKQQLIVLMQKLKTYFLINGILMIIYIVFAVLIVFVLIGSGLSVLNSLKHYR